MRTLLRTCSGAMPVLKYASVVIAFVCRLIELHGVVTLCNDELQGGFRCCPVRTLRTRGVALSPLLFKLLRFAIPS